MEMLEARDTGFSKALGALPGPLLHRTKHPENLPESHSVSAGPPQAYTGIIQCSGKGENHGNSPVLQVSFMLPGH